ncbi:30S ribosomal protein S5 [Candidatus Kaiserbacteria bacterium]|nr:MAG: 30S ribosomal protein S5 [Candidatus Kaiserbacteria bacterium]
MTDDIKKTEEGEAVVAKTDAAPATDPKAAAPTARTGGAPRGGRGPQRSGGRRPQRGERGDRTPEFAQKIIGIRRVTRVMGGGRRFSFSVAMVIGDKKGRVGVGTGKAGDTALAIEKAIRDAKKNMITIARTETNSLPHNTEAKYGSTVIEIRPAQGRGLVAGASVRTVLELGGVTDVTTKILSRSKNKTNIARAAVVALLKLEK